MLKNKLQEVFTTYSYYTLYLLFILITLDNNSNLELMLKTGVSFAFLFFLNKSEVTKILLVFYRLFFILYLLFFISYFLADDESSKHLANTIYTLCIFILPGYVLAYLVVLFRDKKNFLTNIFFNIAIFISFVIPHLGYRSGIVNMTYTESDVFVFILILLQLIVHVYNYFKK